MVNAQNIHSSMKARLGQAPGETQRHLLVEEEKEKRFPFVIEITPSFVLWARASLTERSKQ